ncbi:hypothetical protein ACS0TY_008862 [Phlomoides rotata]
MKTKVGEEADEKIIKETTAEEEDDDIDESSPRGVLEIPITGSDSDMSTSFGSDKSAAERGAAWEINYGTLHWKKLFGQIKRKSSMKFSTIPLLGGFGYDFSKKAFKKKQLGRNHSAGDAIDCGDFEMPKPSWRNFSYQELKIATDNFAPENLIGKGGHAEVYKGFLPDGQVVAVKKIIKEKKNDENRVGDFLSELGIIAHIDHPNTAKLIGFSADSGLHLVLQFAPHGSLATVLHGGREESMEWKRRYKVAIGVAEGLEYLHSGSQRRIIHRDITASNILLSGDYEAQISDFGLAKWLPEKWLHHVVSPIEGTFGYMAPEYFMHGVVHEKTDVFAFGVLLLELITGRRAVDSCRQSLVMWAKPYLERSDIKEIADPKLGQDYNVTEMKRAMFTASICIHHLPNMRPNMSRVVKLLKGENEAIDVKQKSLGMKSLLWDSCDLEEYSSTTYLKDLNRHMELVME